MIQKCLEMAVVFFILFSENPNEPHHIQRNVHIWTSLCFADDVCQSNLPMSFTVASCTSGKSYKGPDASDIALKTMGKCIALMYYGQIIELQPDEA